MQITAQGILDVVKGLADGASKFVPQAAEVSKLIEAGELLAGVIQTNIKAAAETASDEDMASLRERAAKLGDTNRALSSELDTILGG